MTIYILTAVVLLAFVFLLLSKMKITKEKTSDQLAEEFANQLSPAERTAVLNENSKGNDQEAWMIINRRFRQLGPLECDMIIKVIKTQTATKA